MTPITRKNMGASRSHMHDQRPRSLHVGIAVAVVDGVAITTSSSSDSRLHNIVKFPLQGRVVLEQLSDQSVGLFCSPVSCVDVGAKSFTERPGDARKRQGSTRGRQGPTGGDHFYLTDACEKAHPPVAFAFECAKGRPSTSLACDPSHIGSVMWMNAQPTAPRFFWHRKADDA